MTRIEKLNYTFSPSFVQMVEDKISDYDKGLSINLSEDEVNQTSSHSDYINQMFVKMLSLVDDKKWSEFCTKNADQISFIYEAETTALKSKQLQEAEYYDCLEKIIPIINKLEDSFFECIKR